MLLRHLSEFMVEPDEAAMGLGGIPPFVYNAAYKQAHSDSLMYAYLGSPKLVIICYGNSLYRGYLGA